ncbi:MAG TPA: DUF4349 domain-containing protein, partial [bacterium]|nr:DUF4349 domain-containing protein [bacterium]
EGAGGFVAASSTSRADRTPQGAFTVRVPAARFSAVLLEVERLGTVESRRVSGQDVTEEFVDLQARLRNLERHESRLQSFMDRATRVGDLLAIERELARVRGEIEVLTGRLRFLEHQVALATVEVALRQKAPAVGGRLWDAGATLERMAAAFRATLRQLAAAFEAVAVMAAALLPVGVLGAVVVGIVRRWRRARAL